MNESKISFSYLIVELNNIIEIYEIEVKINCVLEEIIEKLVEE